MLMLQGLGLWKVIGIIIFLTSILLIIKRVKIYKAVLILTFEIYLINLIVVCFFPITLEGSYNTSIIYNLIPFKSIYNILQGNPSTIIRQLLGNVILLAPLAIFIPLLFQKISCIKAFIVCVIFSVSIESLQFIIDMFIDRYKSKVIDIDDVILNSIGILFGLLFYKLIKNPIYKLKNMLENS